VSYWYNLRIIHSKCRQRIWLVTWCLAHLCNFPSPSAVLMIYRSCHLSFRTSQIPFIFTLFLILYLLCLQVLKFCLPLVLSALVAFIWLKEHFISRVTIHIFFVWDFQYLPEIFLSHLVLSSLFHLYVLWFHSFDIFMIYSF
jgi:hypothetical protein